MIPRILVPRDVRPYTDNGDKTKPSRKSTYLDDRTVVPSGLSDAPPLTGKTNIPQHLPLGVLVNRTLVERGMEAKPFGEFGPITEQPHIDILDSRVVVPAYVEPPEQREIDRFDQPQEMTPELRELVQPDIFTTGEANLLVEPEDQRDAKWDAITRAASVAGHIAFVIFLIFLPKLFPAHVPTREEIEMASKSLGVVYLPPDAGELSKAPGPPPAPKVKIDNKTLNKVAPPRKEEHAAPPAPNPERPRTDLPAAPAPQPDAHPLSVPPTNIPPPPKSVLLPAEPQPTTSHLNLGLPTSSPGKAMSDQLQDAIGKSSHGSYSTDEGVPGGTGQNGGRGGRGAQTGNAVDILSPTEGVDFDPYIRRLIAKVKQNWYAVMPESVYLGDKGVVSITFRINRDGSFPIERLNLDRTSGKDPLDAAAMSSIRASNPFEPLPPQFKGPYIELRFTYYYNLKPGSAQ
ncbi:MAG TPA: TonB C-terminal domain-containing protein [Candidatus Acidoferrales bacterium]